MFTRPSSDEFNSLTSMISDLVDIFILAKNYKKREDGDKLRYKFEYLCFQFEKLSDEKRIDFQHIKKMYECIYHVMFSR